MFLFNRKSPEEKEAARLEKLRRTEGDRAFGGAIMTPVSSLSLADICMVRLVPEAQALQINCGRKSVSIPYAALRGMTTSSEAQIAQMCIRDSICAPAQTCFRRCSACAPWRRWRCMNFSRSVALCMCIRP